MKAAHLALYKASGAILLDELAHDKANILVAGNTRQEEELILPVVNENYWKYLTSTRPTCF